MALVSPSVTTFSFHFDLVISVIMEADRGSEASEASYSTHYCSVAEAMKIISRPFDGNKKKSREFIEKVDVEFELVHSRKHDLLLKFIKTK